MKQTKKKMTAGELLARKLKGDKSITEADIDKATVDFFAANGVHCEIVKDESNNQEER